MSRVQMSFRTTPEKRELLIELATSARMNIGDFLVEKATARDESAEYHGLCVRSALRWIAEAKPVKGPFWHSVALVFGLGTTSAEKLCVDFGFDSTTGAERAKT